MKKKAPILVVLAFVGMIVLFLSADITEQVGKDKSTAEHSEDIHVKIPRKLSFAGEVVPLQFLMSVRV